MSGKKNDPYADDDLEKSISKADEAAQQRLREKTKEPPSDPNAATEIDLDDEEEEEPGQAAQPQRSPRQEQRGNRWREHTERTTAAEKRAEEAEARARAAEQRAVTLETVQRVMPQPQQQPQENPLKKELAEVRRIQQATWAEYNQKGGDKLPQADQDAFMARAHELRDREFGLVARMTIPEQRGGDENPERTAVIARIRMEYPDVAKHDNARIWAVSRYQQLVAEGKRDDFSTAQLALEEARKAFRLGPQSRPAPTDNLKKKTSGIAAGGGGGTNGDSSRRVIVMTPERKKMAEAWAPKGTKPAEAHKMWAQKVGSKLLEKGLA